MEIPSGFAQSNLFFGGSALPTGAQMTIGWDVGAYAGDPAALAQDIVEAWNGGDMDQLYSSNVAFEGCLVKFGPTATGPSAFFGSATSGTASTATVAPNTSALIHKNTALGGRAGRGRMFQPGMPETEIDQSGTMNETWRGALETEWNTFFSTLAIENVEAVVLHGDTSPISTPTPITSISVDVRVATQRRRLRR